jgi:polysaccharide biosynthesis protein PslG
LRRTHIIAALLVAIPIFLLLPAASSAQQALDVDVATGHFYTQTNGSPLGTSPTGYTVTNDDGVAFWDAYQKYGGPLVLGYPVTGRFLYDGFVTQAMQKAVFQWRPDTGQVAFLNTFDALHDKGKDDWLLAYRQTPKPFDTSPDTVLSFDQVVARHLAFLDQNQAIKSLFLSDPSWLDHYGLPVSYADEGNSFVIRAQRATFQYWKQDVPWAKAGDVTVANGGDLAKEAGLWPFDATVPSLPPANAQLSAGTPSAGSTGYRAKSPEYSADVFVYGFASTAARDLQELKNANFGWQRTLVQWKGIETTRGQFDWTQMDKAVQASNAAGIKMIATVDFGPAWARADGVANGPPDNPQDFRDFIYALVSRYKTGSTHGHVDAVEMWNEPNLSREWGGQTPNASQYINLLKAGYQGAKWADPTVTVLSSALTPTGTYDSTSTPDDVFLQQMYDAGAKDFFDVLGVHAPGYKAPPQMSPDQVAADPSLGGYKFFAFRHVEDLRGIMVKNGDSGKQIWVTEFGWTSDPIHPAYSWFKVTQDQQAQYIVDAYKWAVNNWSPWIGVMSVWNLPEPDWTQDREEYWWSIANPDGTPRPAYTALLQARQNGVLP